MKFIKSRITSFKCALVGLKHVLRTQKNAWIHFIATFIVVILAIWLNLSINNWIALLLVIGLVWISEFLNTALEVIVDLASPDRHPLAKVGKDVGAAAVLIAALLSFIIGLLIFLPHLIEKF